MEQLISAKQLRQIVADGVQQALDGARIDPTDSSWNWIASERLSFLKLIDSMPIADTNVDPLWHGHNICNQFNSGCEFVCSVCGATVKKVIDDEFGGGKFNYCPNCGAMMD